MAIDGRTSGKANDYASFCGDKTGTSPDVAVAVDMPIGGILDAQVYATSTGFNPTLYVRSDCSVDEYCADFGAVSEEFRAELPAGIHYIIVDGSGGTSGTFRLFLSVTPPVCGDGIVSASLGEQCDVGDPIPDDGCGDPGTPSECQRETPDSVADVPPGLPITLMPGTNLFHGTTIGYHDDLSGTCSQHGAGADRFYWFEVPPLPSPAFIDVWIGYLEDGVTPACNDFSSPYCWDAVLYFLQQQPDGTWVEPPKRGTPYDRCCKDFGAIYPENLRRTLYPGERYAISIDGYDGEPYSQGQYNLVVYLYIEPPSYCPTASPCIP
jgi:hypothetical protein